MDADIYAVELHNGCRVVWQPKGAVVCGAGRVSIMEDGCVAHVSPQPQLVSCWPLTRVALDRVVIVLAMSIKLSRV